MPFQRRGRTWLPLWARPASRQDTHRGPAIRARATEGSGGEHVGLGSALVASSGGTGSQPHGCRDQWPGTGAHADTREVGTCMFLGLPSPHAPLSRPSRTERGEQWSPGECAVPGWDGALTATCCPQAPAARGPTAPTQPEPRPLAPVPCPAATPHPSCWEARASAWATFTKAQKPARPALARIHGHWKSTWTASPCRDTSAQRSQVSCDHRVAVCATGRTVSTLIMCQWIQRISQTLPVSWTTFFLAPLLPFSASSSPPVLSHLPSVS